jgi:hypothetical protein
MKQGYYKIPRRSFLIGAGACLALPTLEIMGAALSKEKARKIPLRLGVFHKGNGIDPKAWQSKGTETKFTLSENLHGLKNHINDVAVLSNINNHKGDHYGAMPLLMTGLQSRNPEYTFDQVIADKIGAETQFKSFHMSADPVDIRSITLNSLSHDKNGRPLFVERNAQFAFNRLFRGLSDKNVRQEQSSILDAVRQPTADLLKRASHLDKQVIANYLDSVRDVELAIKRQESSGNQRRNLDKVNSDVLNLEDFPAKIKTMSDLIALAFWTDTTRVASFNMAQESSRRIHDFLGLKADFHWSSHFDKNKKLAVEFNKANTWYVAQFGQAIEKMKSLKEVDGSSVFDNSVLMFGSGLSHGGKHSAVNMPLILAGGKNSGLNTGRFLHYSDKPSHANCLLTLIQHFGVEMDSYSKSTGTLDRLRKQ